MEIMWKLPSCLSEIRKSLIQTLKQVFNFAFVLLLAFTASVQAATSTVDGGSPPSDSAADLARKTSNPLGGDFIMLINQFDNFFLKGDITDDYQNYNNWAFQPVIPISMKDVIGDGWIWVNRPTINIVLNSDVPDEKEISRRIAAGTLDSSDVPFESVSGFGDISYFALLGKATPTKKWGSGEVVLAGGATFQFPTASRDEIGSGKYSAGPAATAAFIGKRFVLGSLVQQWWDYGSGGNGSGDDVNLTNIQLFYFLNLGGGWQVGGSPIITADWENDSDEVWTVPIGLGVYKTSFFGKLPVKMGLEAQYMPIRPDELGQEYNIRVVITPIIPNIFN